MIYISSQVYYTTNICNVNSRKQNIKINLQLGGAFSLQGGAKFLIGGAFYQN